MFLVINFTSNFNKHPIGYTLLRSREKKLELKRETTEEMSIIKEKYAILTTIKSHSNSQTDLESWKS